MKRILMICPFPFLQHRGSPLLVYNCVTALSDLGYFVDLLCFPLGVDPKIRNVNVHSVFRFTRNIPIGFSWMKPFYDILLLFKAIQFRIRNNYDIIHGQHFEGALIGTIIKCRLSLYYTIHSMLSEEMRLNKVLGARNLQSIFKLFEKMVYRSSQKIFPVSPSFAYVIGDSYKGKCFFIPDISPKTKFKIDICKEVSRILPGKIKYMYTGNLSAYQGIDILIEAFKKIDACLIIIGGDDISLRKYKKLSEQLELDNIHCLGQRLSEDIPSYLFAADVLISPRLEGSNIPSKLYTYIEAKKPIILTEIEAHTQIEQESFLYCKPNSKDMANKITLMLDSHQRESYQKKVVNAAVKYSRKAYINMIKNTY